MKPGMSDVSDVCNVSLKGQLRIRQRARHRDVFDRGRPVVIGRRDLRLVEQRIRHEIAQA